MLSSRREALLKIIVDRYTREAVPVASEVIARDFNLKISPATIRNEIARLEEEGYVTRPHISAGSVPSVKGYRHYVTLLIKEAELPEIEQRSIRQLFNQAPKEFEEWARLAALVLARLVRNVALVTVPKASECRFRHLDLVALQEYLVLLILVLQEAKLRRQLLTISEKTSQGELDIIANKLSALYSGLNTFQITTTDLNLSPLETQITEAVARMMASEDEKGYELAYLEGLRLMLEQPEFADNSKLLALIEMIEERSLQKTILSLWRKGSGMQVVIGEENEEEPLKEFSLVVSGYGLPDEVSGAIGVIGPMRMEYSRSISAVRYLSSLLSDLVLGVCNKTY